jgi:hypothetical protein
MNNRINTACDTLTHSQRSERYQERGRRSRLERRAGFGLEDTYSPCAAAQSGMYRPVLEQNGVPHLPLLKPWANTVRPS